MPFVKEDTRALARIVKIDEIKPIKKADRLEIAVVGGWECVVAKDLYKAGDTAVYFEIDAAVPLDSPIWGDFDKKYLLVKQDEENGGKQYAVIKTLKLRSTLSQGLLMQLKNLESIPALLKAATGAAKGDVEVDLTAELNVMKFVNAAEYKLYLRRLAEEAREASGRGTKSWWWKLRMKLIDGIIVDGLMDFPRGHVKSEEERLQNLGKKEYEKLRSRDEDWEASIKLNGESSMVYSDLDTDLIGIAQRNFSLRTEPVPYTRKESFRVFLSDWMRFIPRRLRGGACTVPKWKTEYDPKSVPLVKWMIENDVVNNVKALNWVATEKMLVGEAAFLNGKKIAIQGEMVGPDFNGGAEGFPVNQFFMYRAYGNGNYKYTPDEVKIIAGLLKLKYIPVDTARMKLPADMATLIKMADGKSALGVEGVLREGLVLKNHETGESFKVISNKWLENEPLGEEETAVS
jgi:hypothetical protein